ncbi:MAG: glucokinase [Cellvibrionaceae bacterium]
MNTLFPFLVSDIGGTNARFSIVTGRNDQGYQMSQTRDLVTGEYQTFEACVAAYLDTLEGPVPKRACIAVAGPVAGDEIRFTNVNWVFSIEKSRQSLGFDSLLILNDFAALACSVPHLGDGDTVEILAGEAQPQAPKAIVGPGTGLGVAALVYTADRWVPVPGEGGHVAYAAQTPREHQLAQRLQSGGYLCAQHLISGLGLVTLYNTLAEIDNCPDRVVSGGEVSERAFDKGETLALEAMNIFCDGIGTLVGNSVVTYVAKGGVYLGGGILPRMVEFFRASGFERRMKERGALAGFMDSIPVYLIVHKHPALIGAAAWLEDSLAGL